MRDPSLLHRFFALWCLVLHLGLSTVGPTLDARIETEEMSPEALALHVEEPGNPHCAPDHHHQVCLVRALESMNIGAEFAPISDIDETDSTLPAMTSPMASSSSRIPGLGPRAPPIA